MVHLGGEIGEEFRMHNGRKLLEQHLGMERYAVKEPSAVGVAHIDTLVLESEHLPVQIISALQVVKGIDVGPLDEPEVSILGNGKHLIEIQSQ